AVLSPFLTVEEAFLFAAYFAGLSPEVKLALGPVPVIGADDSYPKDVRGNPVEPVRFTIRAEKCPNRRGVEAVIRHFRGTVTPFTDVGIPAALFFAGGYPDPQSVEAALGKSWKAPVALVVQDLFPTTLSESAGFVLPATSAF